MSCEFEYCIYNNEGECLYEKVKINSVGMCENCLVVTIEKNYLEMETS